MLLVSSSVGVIHGVHRHTSDLGPLVTLGLVFVKGATSFKHRLIGTSTASDEADLGAATALDGLLGSRGKSDSSKALVGILSDNDGVVTRSSGHLTAITSLGLDVADNSSFGDLANRKDISNSNLSYKLRITNC